MKTTIVVCVTLIAAGLAASQIPYLIAQDGPPADGPPPAPTAPELPSAPTAGEPTDVVPPATSLPPLPPLPPLSTGQQGPQPSADLPTTVIDVVPGQAVGGYGLSTAPEPPRRGARRTQTVGVAAVPAPPPTDPRLREMAQKYNQLEQEVLRLAAAYRRLAADAPERETTLKQIAEITQQQFDLRQDARKLEIENLQKQLDQLQGKLQKREEKREQIVQQRVEQLTDQKDELRWEPLEPAGAARYVEYADVYRGGVAIPPGVMYGGQQLALPPVQPANPASARDGQPPEMVPPVPPVPSTNDSYDFRPRVVNVVPVPSEPPGTMSMSPPPAQQDVSPSILEAKARLEAATQEFQTLKTKFDMGLVSSLELQRAEGERKMAQAALAAAEQQLNLQLKMLELDVRRAESEVDSARADLDAQTKLADEKKDPLLDAMVRKAKSHLAQMELDVARAEAMLQAAMQQMKWLEDEPELKPESKPDAQQKR